MRLPPLPRARDAQGRRRRSEWLYAAAIFGGLLIAARATRLADAPQLAVSVLAAFAFGALAAFILRHFRPAAPLKAQLALGLAAAAALFGGWYFLGR